MREPDSLLVFVAENSTARGVSRHAAPVSTRVHGFCEPAFAAVGEAFERGFAERGELGAAVAVHLNGRLVVDLWAGNADPEAGSPWAEDTIAHAYSVSKPLVATCALVLADRGELDLDAPVARYWPEYAQAGKERTLVRHLLAHQTGILALPEPQPPEALLDWDRLTGLLAAAPPLWEPGTKHGEEAGFYGHLVGEVVRRVDGRSLGRFLAEEIAEPVGARLPHRPRPRRAGPGGAAGGPSRRLAAVGPRRPAPLGGGFPRQPAGDAGRRRRQLGRVPGRRDPRGQRPRDGARDRALLRRPRRRRRAGRRPAPAARDRGGRFPPAGERPRRAARGRGRVEPRLPGGRRRVVRPRGIGGFSGYGLRRPGVALGYGYVTCLLAGYDRTEACEDALERALLQLARDDEVL